jgi:hypothetical protein
MIWKEISENYPISFDQFLTWSNRASFMKTGQLHFIEGGLFDENLNRELYDFFDSIPILITLYHFDMGEFCVKINLYENYREDEKMFESDGHIEEIYDSCDANLIFDTRIEAENHAFVTAFTFLEARINVFSQNTPSV